jgi:hypothetical protein
MHEAPRPAGVVHPPDPDRARAVGGDLVLPVPAAVAGATVQSLGLDAASVLVVDGLELEDLGGGHVGDVAVPVDPDLVHEAAIDERAQVEVRSRVVRVGEAVEVGELWREELFVVEPPAPLLRVLAGVEGAVVRGPPGRDRVVSQVHGLRDLVLERGRGVGVGVPVVARTLPEGRDDLAQEREHLVVGPPVDEVEREDLRPKDPNSLVILGDPGVGVREGHEVRPQGGMARVLPRRVRSGVEASVEVRPGVGLDPIASRVSPPTVASGKGDQEDPASAHVSYSIRFPHFGHNALRGGFE